MRIVFVLVALLSAVACQSQDPGGDAGMDAGLDDAGRIQIGRDAGLGTECTSRQQCAGWDAGSFSFACGEGVARTCLNGYCVGVCNTSGFTCHFDPNAECDSCGSGCGASTCSPPRSCVMTVITSECPNGPGVGVEYTAVQRADCQFDLLNDAGVVVGQRWDFSVTRSYATFEGLDGVCVGSFGDAWSCPGGCWFTTQGC